MIELRTGKTRKQLTAVKEPMAMAIIATIDAMREWWPLTVRQVHYQLLNNPPMRNAKRGPIYRNDPKSYHDLCDVLARLRLAGRVEWGAVTDPTRPFDPWRAWTDQAEYVEASLAYFLTGYSRDLLQTQANHVEVIGEKLTVQSTLAPVCEEYGVPLLIGRGFASLDPRRDVVQRFEESGKSGLVLLFVTDHDPSGEEIAHSFARSIVDDFGVTEDEIDAVKVALTEEQVIGLKLPPKMMAKRSDSNYARFAEQYGDVAHELEAVPPQTLQDMLREAIKRVLDMGAFRSQRERQADDRGKLADKRNRILAFAEQNLSDWDGR